MISSEKLYWNAKLLFIISATILISLFIFHHKPENDQYLQGNIEIDHDNNCKNGKYIKEPPYLYVTVHDNLDNVLKYSRDGCLLQSDVLINENNIKKQKSRLRSIVFGKYQNKQALFVADASTLNSKIQIYGDCLNKNTTNNKNDYGKRKWIKNVIESKYDNGVEHTYGIGFDYMGHVYSTHQHTGAVLHHHKDSHLPLPLPPVFYKIKPETYFNGTFHQFGVADNHRSLDDDILVESIRSTDTYQEGVRSIIGVRNDMWIANEDLSAVLIVGVNTGLVKNFVHIINPIGLYYDKDKDIVFVGSKSKKNGYVYAVNAKDMLIIKSYKHDTMKHPVGIVSFGNTLYVGEQNKNVILTFNIITGTFIEVIVHSLISEIEQLALSYC